jgi:serine/threonine protein phosphatase 1
MLRKLISRLLRPSRARSGSANWRRLRLDPRATVYAVGDVHGCLTLLRDLEAAIMADARDRPGPKTIVMLGDYVDKGPESAQVLDHLCGRPPRGFQRLCLGGNHEMAMLDFLEGREPLAAWLGIGGLQALYSYGIDPNYLSTLHKSDAAMEKAVRKAIPEAHKRFLRELGLMAVSDEAVLVHAGLRPGVSLKKQSVEDCTTIRMERIADDPGRRRWLIHGHSPVEHPTLVGRRLNIDTGAVKTGLLTAVRLSGTKAKLIFARQLR